MKDIAKQVAMKFLGKPYIWGGDDPMNGFDCSGFCIEILKSVGLLPRKGDWTAAMLWEQFKDKEVSAPYEGCLVFWKNNSGKIIHIEYAIDTMFCIGASGGGSKTQSEDDALDQNAYIKIRPWATRSNVRGFIDPFKK